VGETVGDLEEDRIAIRSNFCSITYQKNTVMIMPKILIVATGIGAYANAILPTGLWLSELTHIYHRAKGLGCKITIASPKGGEIPVDPESLKPFTLDKMSKAYWNDPEFRELLHHAQSLDEVAENGPAQLSSTLISCKLLPVFRTPKARHSRLSSVAIGFSFSSSRPAIIGRSPCATASRTISSPA
jgi:hypothetical protein